MRKPGICAEFLLYDGCKSEYEIWLGINAPFGLKTEYDAGWAGRFKH